ncbi:MAG: hypothetical protein Q9159_003112 [Coniocarpon cinnabarinum]
MHSVAALNLRRRFSDQTAQTTPRRASFTFPERFKDGDDASIDVIAPSNARQRYVNQSFLSMIANVGSNIPPEPQASLENDTIHGSAGRIGSRLSSSEGALGVPTDFPKTVEDGVEQVSEHSEHINQSAQRRNEDKHTVEEPSEAEVMGAEDDMSSSVILPARHKSSITASVSGLPEKDSPSSSCGQDGQADSRLGREPQPLQASSGEAAKSGFFLKRGPRNPTFHRYWFVLRGNVLSYYQSASTLYFPLGTIDLRSAITAQLEKAADDGSGKGFSITTSQRIVRFKAESVASAQEWVKKIQQAIFHSHNVGNSLKISLPIQSIVEIEDNPLFERWETLKIKAVDNEESFAVDEYFFSFMNHENRALELLRKTILNDPSNRMLVGARRDSGPRDDGFDEQTLSSPRSQDSSQKHFSEIALSPAKSTASRALSYESYDEVADTSAADPSDSESNEPLSASRILKGSDIFHQRNADSPHNIKRVRSPLETNDLQGLSVSQRSDSQGQIADSQSTIHPTSSSSSRIDSLMRASNASVQKASGIADVLRTQSKRVSEVIASESRTYYDKVANMWSGRVMHFDSSETPLSQGNMEESEMRQPDASAGDRYRSYFALSEQDKLEATYHGFLLNSLPIYGKLYLGNRKLCFRALMLGVRTKMVLPLRDIITIDKVKGINLGYSGLIIVVRGHEELFLEFGQPEARDDLAVALQKRLSNSKEIEDSRVMTEEDVRSLEAARKEYDALEEAHRELPRRGEDLFESIAIDEDEEVSPVIFDDIDASIVDFKPRKSLRVVCLTIGSRGDVQPYIALCRGLKKDGHRPLIATHEEFEPWIRKHGIDFAPVAGNPAEIMQLCVENDMFTMNFFREINTKMKPWFDRLLDTAWKACQGADLLIESPSAMAGIHIAQALEIPYFRAFSMIWTRTRAYPHPFIVPKQKLGGNYNYLSYVIVDKFLWQASAYQINKWRTKALGLPPTSFERLKVHSVPFLYNFSASVVTRPLDFSPWIHVTGNWFLDESQGYEPPEELADFIDRARGDGKKLVYVGFGSMVIENRAATTKTIVDSVLKADVRCIFSKGWSDRLQGPYDTAEIAIPSELIVINSAPHDWLFKEIDAAVHHGGAGTTAASLRAGIPTIVKPFFGDQRFYGARVEDLGVGRCLELFNTSVFSRALWEATHNERIIEKARALGEQIRAEDGVANAIQMIYRDMEYAKSLIRFHSGKKSKVEEEGEVDVEADDGDDGSMGWTMVEEDAADADEFDA